MSESDPVARLEPLTSTLRYRTYNGHLDVEHLTAALETVHSLIHSGMPGGYIRHIAYDGKDLTIEVGS